ncbi:cysteine desulfurase [Patescibacteria group bacterium]|nr:cysteine desulfurase [Patescibacteria group bacterium]MBU1673213.1 cysteine desulfurase [Patescibacteria group bacterium]MBU1963089.1 cysteine desulfurase [Patescibacteria group bacterium]
MKYHYFDNAATTPMDPRVFKAMEPYFSEEFGNPMSVHTPGQIALQALDNARNSVSKFLNCLGQEVIFTSGATESNNLAIKGIIQAYSGKDKPHVITSAIEHHCVLETVERLEKEGKIGATYIKPQPDGVIKAEDVIKEIKDNTVLISIMYVNNEIGTIQPIAEIGKNKGKAIFHTDAVQAVNYLDCDVKKLNIDMLSLSGHKIYGPKGIGAIFVKQGTALKQIQQGGAQEAGLRAGTHNVPGIVGLGKAIELISKEGKKDYDKVEKLRDQLWAGIQKNIKNADLNGSLEQRIPSNLNISFKNIEGEGILISLDMEGIAASTGSACSSGSLEPSHVMMALQNDPLRAHSSTRFSLGRFNTEEDVKYLLKKLPPIIEKLRKISPFK